MLLKPLVIDSVSRTSSVIEVFFFISVMDFSFIPLFVFSCVSVAVVCPPLQFKSLGLRRSIFALFLLLVLNLKVLMLKVKVKQ